MNPLEKIASTLVAGLILAVVLLYAGKAIIPPEAPIGGAFLVLDRWLHVAAGVTWIGLLYYFNFVQVPALAAATADKGGPGGAGITKYVAPRALLWFRWAAVVTWLSGAAYLIKNGQFVGAFTLGFLTEGGNYYQAMIGLGAWLGTIMIFNVWVLIWPNQAKVLGLKPATDEEKAKARRVAFLASRTNTMLSIPMLLFMVVSAHGLPF